MQLIALSLYGIVALAFLTVTYLEGLGRRDGWDSYRVLGLSLCLAWPVLIVFVLFEARKFKRTERMVETT
jgi:hypothetical protein